MPQGKWRSTSRSPATAWRRKATVTATWWWPPRSRPSRTAGCAPDPCRSCPMRSGPSCRAGPSAPRRRRPSPSTTAARSRRASSATLAAATGCWRRPPTCARRTGSPAPPPEPSWSPISRPWTRPTRRATAGPSRQDPRLRRCPPGRIGSGGRDRRATSPAPGPASTPPTCSRSICRRCAHGRARPAARGFEHPGRTAEGGQELPRLPDRGRGRPRRLAPGTAGRAWLGAVSRARGRPSSRAGAPAGSPRRADDAPRTARGAGVRGTSARGSKRTSRPGSTHTPTPRSWPSTRSDGCARAPMGGATPTRSTSRTWGVCRGCSATGRWRCSSSTTRTRTAATTSWPSCRAPMG